MLSKKARYSLLALIKLAKEYNKGPILIQDIAESEKLPKKFLEAILLELKKHGIVSSKKGKGGGYYLIRKPQEVNLADIIRKFDGAIALLPCVTYNYYETCEHCKDEDTCGLRDVIKDVRDASVTILKNSSLYDVIHREEKLIRSKKNK